MEYEIDHLKELLKEKRKTTTDASDLAKIAELEQIFNNDQCFFSIRYDVALAILRFVGIKEEELMETYQKLIDPQLVTPTIKVIRD